MSDVSEVAYSTPIFSRSTINLALSSAESNSKTSQLDSIFTAIRYFICTSITIIPHCAMADYRNAPFTWYNLTNKSQLRTNIVPI